MIAPEPGTPCGLCAVRPDVACRHRPADPAWQNVKPSDAGDKRKFNGARQQRDGLGRMMALD